MCFGTKPWTPSRDGSIQLMQIQITQTTSSSMWCVPWSPHIPPWAEPFWRCPHLGHLHYPVRRLGQGRHYRERFQNIAAIRRREVGLVWIPSECFPHISRRGYSGFWTSRTSQSVLWCARSGVRVSLLITVNSTFHLENFSPIIEQFGSGDIVRRISMTKVSLLGSGLDGSQSKIGYGPSRFGSGALTPFLRESYTSSRFLRGSRLARATQHLTSNLVTNHPGKLKKNSGVVRLLQYRDRVRWTCGRCTKS